MPQDCKNLRPEIDWRGIVGLRNITIPAYFRVEWELVWRAATEDLPELKRSVDDIVRREYPEIDARVGNARIASEPPQPMEAFGASRPDRVSVRYAARGPVPGLSGI